ncbi:hypothetical protein APUTEX25_003703, partial [Auxenochlorella protothecoides]
SEGAPSQPRLELPPSLRPNEEVFVCRYTGQIFREYEDYTRQITAHRQREWSCRYSRVSGLTYEEAVTSEYGVQSLIDQFPAVCEEPALRLVHHSTEPLDVLCATIISHMQSHLVPGEPVAAAIAGAGLVPCLVQRAGPRLGADGLPAEYEVLPMGPAGLPAGGAVPVPSSSLRRPEPSFLDRLTPALLRRWVAALAEPEPVASVPGLACLWVVRPHWAAKHGLAAELPAPLAARLRPARGKARGWEGVDADADLARAIAAAEGGVAQYARAAELRLAVTAEAGEDGAAAARDDVEPEPGREAGAHALPKEEPQGEAELGEEGEPGAAPQDAPAEDGPAEGSEAERRAAETQEAIERLQLIIDGPSTPPRLLEDGKEQASLASALDVAEFLQLFGGACEAPTLDLPAVMSSVRWPLDGEGLGGLYNQLVLVRGVAGPGFVVEIMCCLIEQYNHDPPAKARSHRWSRVLTASTWPEILRRYLLTTRADQGPPAEDACPLSLDNDQVALLAARKLETTAWHQLEPELHLRLLCTLCYDISQGYALRNDINVRLQDAIRIQTELFKEQMAWRKARRGEGETAVAAPTSGKKKKAARKSTTAADPTEEELQALEDQAAAEAGEDGDDDAGTEELDEAQQAWAAREAEYEGRLAERSSRADPLGTDRFHRRYWWLASAPGIVMVDFPDAAPPAALRSKEQLDELLARLNRRGPRERVLHGALRKRYAAIVACMAQAEGTAYSLEGYARPVPRDKRMAVRTLPELEEVRNALAEAKERLDNFLAEAVEVGVELEFDAKAMRKTLRACDTPEDLRHAMLELEKVYCTAGEGLPPGATDREIQILMGEAAADEPEAKPGATASTGPTRAEPGVGVEPMQGMEGPGSAGAEPVPAEAQVAKGTDAAAPDSAGHAAAALPGAGVEAAAPVAAPGPSTTPSPATTPPTPAQPTPQASGTGAAGEATGTTCEGEEGEEGETAGTPAPFRPVTRDDDLDDSDAEHAFLREKRMRRPARLWRSARERAAWVQATRACATAAQVSYSALLLSDRAGPMLQRYITLAEERRRWEAEERERARSERAGEGEAPAPSLRPMMIRTGKAKTDDGVRVVLKAMGREAFPSGRAAAAMDALAPPELVAECKWGYQCSVCLLAGDLLCCEHPSGCNVSAHRECSGCHGALGGPWICSNHDDRELKTRIRRRAAGSGGLADEGSAGLEGGTADSEATVSEGGMSDDSEATQELTSRRGGKRARR